MQMQQWVNNVHEEFIERFLRQRIERLESSLTDLLKLMGITEDIEAYTVNRNLSYEETAGQYQLRCRVDILEQRLERLSRAFKNLESDALSAAMHRITEWHNLMKAS